MARTTHLQQGKMTEWGHEILIENDKEKNICLKILHINAGKSLPYRFHKNKTQVWYVLSGEAWILYGLPGNAEHAELKSGDSFKVWPWQYYELAASPDDSVEIVISSTYHEDSDDYSDIIHWQETDVSKKKD